MAGVRAFWKLSTQQSLSKVLGSRVKASLYATAPAAKQKKATEAGKAGKAGKGKSGGDNRNKLELIVIESLKPVTKKTVDRSVGELRQDIEFAKTYSRLKMKEHRLFAAEETARLELKKAAIDALPSHLREAALMPDYTPFPINRVAASLTPPIQNYIEESARAAAKEVAARKTR